MSTTAAATATTDATAAAARAVYVPGALGFYGWGAMLSYEGRVELSLALLDDALGERDAALDLLRRGAARSATAGFAACALRCRVEEARILGDAAVIDAVYADAVRAGATRLADRK